MNVSDIELEYNRIYHFSVICHLLQLKTFLQSTTNKVHLINLLFITICLKANYVFIFCCGIMLYFY